ncbi:MAG: hydroxyisourate hydrolase [Acidobacteriota bacterium]|nr:hydroxyisourate hydrolase [Acidobacteriota bacterium]
MSRISTHVLDAVLGKPAAGIPVKLERKEGSAWTELAASATDADGRCRDLAQDAKPGIYRLIFDAVAYLRQKDRTSIYEEIFITFICDGETHYHLPLLLSDNSYTTYRGS